MRCGAQNHYPRIKQAQSVLFMQTPREKYRKSNLIELHPRPIRCAVDPAILWKTTVGSLNGCQPDQRAQRRACLASGEERRCAMHEVARPNEMITTKIVIALGFAPRNAHRCNHRALENFVFVGQ